MELVRRREEDSGLEDVPGRVRRRYRFVVAGFVAMPEHVYPLVGELNSLGVRGTRLNGVVTSCRSICVIGNRPSEIRGFKGAHKRGTWSTQRGGRTQFHRLARTRR